MYITKASWEIVGRCNAKCIHCYAGGTREAQELSEKDTIKLLDNLHYSGIEELSLTGGEPSLSKNFQFIIEYANSLKIGVTVISNGFSLKPQHYELFNNNLAFASLSFHAGSEGSFKQFYGVNDRAYQKFLKTIDNLQHFSLSTCVMGENKHVLEDMLEIVTERKERVAQWVVYNLRKCGNGFKATELSKQDKDKIEKWLGYECLKREINFVNGLEDRDKNNCPLTSQQINIFVAPSGHLRPCYALFGLNTKKSLTESPLEELLSEDIITQWYNPEHNFDNRCKAELLQLGYSLAYITESGGKKAFLDAVLSFPPLKTRVFGEKCRLYNPHSQRAFIMPLEQKKLLNFNGKSIKEYVGFLSSQGYEITDQAIKNLFNFIHALENAEMVQLTRGGTTNDNPRNES